MNFFRKSLKKNIFFKIEKNLTNHFLLILIFFNFVFFSCNNFNQKLPTLKNEENLTINFPDWNENFMQDDLFLQNENCLKLSKWKTVITNKYGVKTYFSTPSEKSIKIKISKDNLCSILIYPILENDLDFFEPAGCVYPTDFQNKNFWATATFQNGTFSKIVQSLFLDKRFFEKEQFLYYFNFEKLKTTLEKNENDFINSFLDLNNNSTQIEKLKNWTTSKISYDLDIDDIVEKILNPPERFYLKYKKVKLFDFSFLNENFNYQISTTKSSTKNISENQIQNEVKISSANNLENKIFHKYVPLNKIKKETGLTLIQEDINEKPISFLINNREILFNKNDLQIK